MRGITPGVLLAAWVAGCAIQLRQPALWPWAWYASAVAASLSLIGMIAISSIAKNGRLIFLAIIAVAAVAFAAVGLRGSWYANDALDPAFEGRDLQLVGLVAAMPQSGDGGIRFRLEVESATAAGLEVRVPAMLQLGWYNGSVSVGDGRFEIQRTGADLRAGERWAMTVRLRAPHGGVNPHGFDYELWLWEQGIGATGYVRAGNRDTAPERLAGTWRYPVEQLRQTVRDSIFARVADRRIACVIAALVAGDQSSIERADWDVFRATGVAHLMSISGLHVTMFAWASAALIGFAWRRSRRACLRLPAQHAAIAGGLLFAAAYAVFSGWGVPAQRTVWMLAAIGLLRLSGRQWPWPSVWLAACAVVVTIDPWSLLQPGFWLSFVAVGVLFATDGGRQTNPLMRLVREQSVVTLALTPLSLLLFGQVSIVGLFANFIAIPWVTLLVTPLAMAGTFVPPAWDAAALLLQVLSFGLQWLASLPFSSITVAVPPLWAGCAGVIGGLLIAMPWPLAVRSIGVPMLLPVLFWQPLRPSEGEFDLLAVDVGQGNAVIVRTANRTLVYDAGPRYSRESDAGHRVMVPLLKALGERVDTLVLSHRDSDHTGGAAAILASQPQARVLGSIEPGHELQAIRPVAPCLAGQHWVWDGVAFEILHPAPEDLTPSAKPNTMSCVLRISTPRASALLAGDIEQPQEAKLARSILPVDVLLVPHHGSKTSSSEPFLDAVRPRLALVQSGYRNRFGHPAPVVMQRYHDRNIEVSESPVCGAALWKSAEPRGIECERAKAKRYWRHVAATGP